MAWAERVTVRRLEQDVERALLLRAGHPAAWQRCKQDPARAQDPIPQSEREMCAHGVDVDATEELVFRVPLAVAALFRAVRARLSFDAMLDHALSTWLRTDPAKRPDPVIARDGYRCAVPGCMSRRNLHDHHIEFRSHQGSDAHHNRITLCAFHHHRGVHAGRVRICGSAPDGLIFELGVRPDAPPLARYRSGDVEIFGNARFSSASSCTRRIAWSETHGLAAGEERHRERALGVGPREDVGEADVAEGVRGCRSRTG